jgi:hypothetical protein
MKEQLKELKFVQGAVAKKDFIPAMTHFAIEDGAVRAYNGVIGLSAPINFGVNCNPKAGPLVNAILHCEDGQPPQLHMTPTGKLSIKSGDFKAFIECVKEETPHVMPEGQEIQFDGAALLHAFETLVDFIGNDASRPWSTGILLRGQSAFATNNVILVEAWLNAGFPVTVCIPKVAVNEMLRINEPPTYAQMTDHSMTFHYPDKRWVRTQLLNAEWPDLDSLLNRDSLPVVIDPRVFVGLAKLRPFSDKMGRVFIKDGIFSTTPDASEGAVYTIPDSNINGIYQIDMLAKLETLATHIDWAGYPSPCLFFGKDNTRGAIVGMRP